MGETTNFHFYDFGIFEPVTKLPNQVFSFLETPGHLKTIEKPWIMFKNIILFVKFRKDARRQLMQIHSKNIKKHRCEINIYQKYEMETW